jgi:hypothetical protein
MLLYLPLLAPPLDVPFVRSAVCLLVPTLFPLMISLSSLYPTLPLASIASVAFLRLLLPFPLSLPLNVALILMTAPPRFTFAYTTFVTSVQYGLYQGRD